MVEGCLPAALACLPLPCVCRGGIGRLWERVGPVFETSFFPPGDDLFTVSRKEFVGGNLCEVGPHSSSPCGELGG